MDDLVFRDIRGSLHLPVWGQPLVQLAPWLRTQAVEPPVLVHANLDQSRFSQDPHVLRRRWLADIQCIHEPPDRLLAVTHQLDDATSVRLSGHLKHDLGSITHELYAPACLDQPPRKQRP